MNGPLLACAIAIFLLCACAGAGEDAEVIPSDPAFAASDELPRSRDGTDRVGIPAPPWDGLEWLGTPPVREGRVVLVRFWTDGCPYCRATAPALAQLHDRYAERGLVVVGVYHPKPRGTTRTRDEVARAAAELGFRFPIAIDDDWSTIDAWWLESGDRPATSASFLLDEQGIVRWVHPGPEYHPGGAADHEQCRRDFADLERAIEHLLGAPDEA